MSGKLTHLQQVALMQRLEHLRRVQDIDSKIEGSRPTAEQLDALETFCSYKVKNVIVTGGNRCLAEGTLVATARGAIPIEQLQVGDITYDEKGQEQYVEAWYDQGERNCVEVWANKRHRMTCTPNHDLYVSKEKTGTKFFKTTAETLPTLARPGLGTCHVFSAPIGSKEVKDAYVIGALLGDGCCREVHRRVLSISSEDASIPNKIAEILGAFNVRKNHEGNFTWQIWKQTDTGERERPFVSYSHWFDGLYAHEKVLELEEIKQWTRQSLCALLAGLIDTDGSVYQTKDGIRLNLAMQATSVIEATQWILLSLWQCPASINIDTREKYKNGPVYYLTISNPWFVDKILREISPFMACDRKKWRPEYEAVQSSRWVPYRVGGAELRPGTLQHVYDITVTGKNNVFLLANGTLSGNSGKTMLLRRIAAWFLSEPDAPGCLWKRRPEWKGPLTGMLVSKSHKQLLGSLLEGIKPFFEGDRDFKIIRNANYIERLEHKKTGNVIYCFVHDNAAQCRERVQSFAAHIVLLDELPSGPSAFKLLEELSARVTDYKGVLGAFFTPKSVNPQIKNYIESLTPPAGKKFSLSFANNPGIDPEAKAIRLSEIRSMPLHMQATILEGSWLNAEQAVYTLSDAAMEDPLGYNPYIWRHLVAVDPGLASAQGVVVLAEDPVTSKWYVIYAEKQTKIADADDGVERVWQLIQKYRWNVCQVTYDPAGIYWQRSAKKHDGMKRYKITAPWNKNSTERKDDMISNLQIALGTQLFIPAFNEDLIDEFNTCEWSDTTEGKIKKGQKFHLLDALRYAVDTLPKFVPGAPAPKSMEEARNIKIRTDHEKYVQQQNKQKSSGWRGGGRIVGIQRMVLTRR